MQKTALFLILLFFNTSISFSQEDGDFYAFMGAQRTVLLNQFKEYERVYTGDYNQLYFKINDNTKISFYFNEASKAYMFTMLKDKEFYDKAKFNLNSVFPNKKDTDDIYWNTRMMALIIIEKDNIILVYKEVAPELLKQE